MAVFQPVRATEEKILGSPIMEGYVYFATDSGKIFLDSNGERSVMGGSGASLFYAQDTQVDRNFQDNYLIDLSSLYEAEAIPKFNDLIINMVDGCFYRVIEVDEVAAACALIAVSGTGGGSGGGTGGGSGDSGNWVTLVPKTSNIPNTFVYGKSYEIRFVATASSDTYINVYAEASTSDGRVNSITKQAISGVEFAIDVGSLLFEGTNKVVISASSDNNGSAEYRMTNRRAIAMSLKPNPNFNPRNVIQGVYNFSCIPEGALEKTLSIYVDNILVKEETILASTSGTQYGIDIPAQVHGIHKVKAILHATLNGVYIETEPLEYNLAWKEADNTSPLVWAPEGYPSKIVQYEDLVIKYVVWDPTKDKDIETHFYKSGIELANSPRNLSYDAATTLSWNITDYDVGNNSYTIMVGSSHLDINVEVERDTNRNLEIIKDGLVLNLETQGRSNEENPSSRLTWKSVVSDIETLVTFKNFNWYNNGWITDADGRSCLRVSNGASIEIPIGPLSILNSPKVSGPLAFEFRFKIRNVQEYATLITTEQTGENEDGSPKIEKTISTEKGVFGRLYNNMGFCLGTQEAFFASKSSTVNARYREDEIVNVTFVVDQPATTGGLSLLYIYLNGLLSGIAQYAPDSDSFDCGTRTLEFNSTYCDIDLYNIRIYKNRKLEAIDVVHNYNADLKDVKSYDTNAIIDSTGNVSTVDYNKMIEYNTTHPDETIMPYMIIESLATDGKLPFVKGGKKPVNIEFHNPALDYAYEQGLIDGHTYLKGAPSFKFTSMKESLDVQGTSSQGYPRRNYKWKAKQKDATWRYLNGPLKDEPIYEYDAAASEAAGKDKYSGATYNGTKYSKFLLDSEIGETTFCFKADYMESSGTHNTGFASFVAEMYDKHPLNDIFGDSLKNEDSLRTTIYGFPMMVFQKTGTETYEFVGRYNFNLDKGATDTCGFSYDGDSKVKDDDGKYIPMEEIAECWEFCNNQGQRCSFITSMEDFWKTGYAYVLADVDADTDFSAKTYYQKVGVNTSTGEDIYEIVSAYDPNILAYYVETPGALELLDDFAYRYSAFEDPIDHAIKGTDEFAGASYEERNNAIKYYMRNFVDLYEWVASTNGAAATGEDLPTPITYGSTTFSKDTAAYRLEKFRYEFKDHFDQQYCEVYFIMTELLHLYDSRGKNMMMATWGPHTEGGNYIWYPIFYDIDTQLGINNSGVPTWDYFAQPTAENNFSTPGSILWNNFWAVFAESTQNRYAQLRKNNLTIDVLDGYYNSHPIFGRGDLDSWKEILLEDATIQSRINSYAKIGKKPVMVHNIDEYYKYIAPTTSGFINTSGTLTRDSGSFFYALQGSRELMRYLYLRNRLNFVDSEWRGGTYATEASKTEFWSRYDANHQDSTSDKYLLAQEGIADGTKISVSADRVQTPDENGLYVAVSAENYPHKLDTIGDFTVKSYLKQFLHVQIDDRHLPLKYCDGNTPVLLAMPNDIQEGIKYQPKLPQQLVYMGGGEYLSDLGDLGQKYLDEIHIPTLKRLKSLKVGSDTEGYYNNQLNSSNFVIGASKYILENGVTVENPNAKSLLESVVLTNLTNLDGNIDVSGSEKLKEFRALGTIISSVNLADGVQIETLHLPKTITALNLVEPIALNGILTNPKDEEGNFNKGLYIKGITDATSFEYDTSAANDNIVLNTYSVIGGSLGYDSYRLLDKLIQFKENMIEANAPNKTLAISLKDVNWTPTMRVASGEPYDETKTYVLDNGRFQLIGYNKDIRNWDADTLNGLVYEYDFENESANASTISDLSIFDTFISRYEDACTQYETPAVGTGPMDKNYYTNTSTNLSRPAPPEVTGLIYVSNDNTEYSEIEVAEKYLTLFPDVKFFFKNLNQSYMATYIDKLGDKETVLYTERIDPTSNNPHITYPENVIPTRLNYDFQGWSLTPDGEVLTKEEIESLVFEDVTSYIFYAVFAIHAYTINFCNVAKDTFEIISTIETMSVDAGSIIPVPNKLPSTDESGLALEKRYKFLGYVAEKTDAYPETEEEGNRKIIDFSNMISENIDRTFYACYIEEDATINTSNMDYFVFNPINVTFEGRSFQGYVVSRNSKYTLSGKITLPTIYNDSPVVAIQGFYGQTGLTHVFWNKTQPANLKWFKNSANTIETGGFGEGAFAYCENLVYVEIPSTTEVMGNGTFYNTHLDFELENDQLLNSNIFFLGVRCFASLVNTNGEEKELWLPGSLKIIKQLACAYTGYYITRMQLGTEENPVGAITIDNSAEAGWAYQNKYGGAGGPYIWEIYCKVGLGATFKEMANSAINPLAVPDNFAASVKEC